MDKNGKLYIAGHTGLFGSALLAEAQKRGFTDIVLRTHAELDLTDQAATDRFFEKERFSNEITVPFVPESELSGIGYTDFLESVWYRRESL